LRGAPTPSSPSRAPRPTTSRASASRRASVSYSRRRGVDLAPFLALDLPPALPAAGAAFRADLGVPANAPLVLVLGRLAPIKRPELALSVFGRVRQELPDARLVFVGDGAIRSLVERSATRRGADYRAHVRFAGNRPDVVAALAAADVVLSTSRNEGLPVAMIEAAAAARPVVSTAVGGVAELVRNGVTGLLAAEEEGLALAVVTLLGDTNERRRMGRRRAQRGRSDLRRRGPRAAPRDPLPTLARRLAPADGGAWRSAPRPW
jgi:glycosyltransferase involved in cell wall biosynthesis